MITITESYNTAYKSMDAILAQIAPTAKVLRQIKSIYSFKAGKNQERKK